MAKTFVGTGRRKRSVARVRMTSGKGKITINGRDVNEYLPFKTLVMDLTQPLEITKTRDKFDIDVTVYGGGFSGQTGAIRLGITRALLQYDENTDPTSDASFRKILKEGTLATKKKAEEVMRRVRKNMKLDYFE